MQKLSGDLVRHKLRTRLIGQNVVYSEQTGSTNTELKRLARMDAPEGLLYLTDEQLVGRGRLERSWHAPAGSSLLTSLLFRPGDYLPPTQAQQLTMICSLAMADAIKNVANVMPGIKWPNDIVWNDGKKLGGVLTESEIEGEQLAWVIVGLGLNVNLDFSDHTHPEPDRPGRPDSGHPPLAETATSLSIILQQDTGHLRLPLLQRYLENVEQRYTALKEGQSPRREWERRLMGIGQVVTVKFVDNARQHRGVMIGIDENGGLRIRQDDGTVKTVLAGDVTLR